MTPQTLPKIATDAVNSVLGPTGADIYQLLIDAEARVLSKGQPLFKQGDLAEHIFFLIRGGLKLIHTENGVETLVTVVEPGEFAGMPLMTERPQSYPHSVISMLSSLVLLIPKSTYLRFWMNHPQVVLECQKNIQKRIFDLQKSRFLLNKKTDVRVADFLLKFGSGPSKKLRYKFTRKEIAAAVGAKQETVIRIMCHFEKSGYIEKKEGLICLLNTPALEAIARGEI